MFVWYLLYNRAEDLFYASLSITNPVIYGVVQAIWMAGGFVIFSYFVAKFLLDQSINRYDLYFLVAAGILTIVLFTVF
jgi:hypothetical protein